MDHLFEKIAKIECLICDVDGVLTDGMNYIDTQGKELKCFNVRDGVGLRLLMAAGIHVAVITGSYNELIDHRMQQLGIQHYFKGQINKRKAYQTLKDELSLSDDRFAYIGDDVVDLPIMQQVGLSIAVGNAVSQVKTHADWVTDLPGGNGAVREACDQILALQHKTELAIERYIHS